jgi:hypothetical protein
MENGQKFGLAIGAMVLGLGLGYLVFRPTMVHAPHSESTQAVTASDAVPVRASAPVAPPAPTAEQLANARAARDAESDREARIGAIDQELRDLPDEDAEFTPQLANEIKLRREQVEELRERVAEVDQGLGSASGAGQPGADSRGQVQLEANVAALQGQLTDAKESVSEQKRQIGWIAASNDPGFIGHLYNELARRSSVVNAIQLEIRDLFGTRQSDLEAAEAERTAGVNALRNDRNALVEAYNDAVAGLSAAQARYQQLLADQAASRKRMGTLSKEKSSLLKP